MRRAAELALLGVAAVWGATFVMVQDAIRELPPMAFLAYRFLPAALVVAAICRRPLVGLSRDGWRAGLVMGAFLTAGYVFQTLGLEHTSASNAGFITGLFVVFTPLLAAAVLRERIAPAAWAAAAVSVAGLYLLTGAGGRLELRGDGFELLCALAFSAHILATSRAAGRHHVGALLAVQLGVVGVACLAAAGAAGQLEAPRGATVWSALLVTSLVASALGFFIQTFAQRHAPPARTALILAAEPAFAGLFGWLFADDRLSPAAWLGAALILAAIVAVELVPRMRPPRPLPEA
jgi:drug/metabolite transporter (DMT)-like permease